MQEHQLLFEVISHRRKFADINFPIELADAIDKVPKFVMDNDFLKVAMDVSVTEPNSILKALPVSRPPFSKFWIEYDLAEFMRICFGEQASSKPELKGARNGAYIEVSDENTENLLINFVRFDSGVLRHPEYEGKLNLFGQFAAPECPITLNEFIQLVQSATLRGWCFASDPRLNEATFRRENFESLKTLINVFSLCCSRYEQDFWYQIVNELDVTGYEFKQLPDEVATTCGLLGYEARLLASSLCLLNSRNLCEQIFIDKRTNERQENLNAVYKGDAYHSLTIKLNRLQKNRARTKGVEALVEIRKHKVRGHFKVRKSGIFWWTSFERGNPEVGYVDKDYRLETGP